MSDFTLVDAKINEIANEVIKLANSRSRVANVLTLLRNHISEIELTPGQDALLRAEGNMLQWKLSDAEVWTDLFDLTALEGDDGLPGPFFTFRVSSGVIQIRLNNAEEGDPWINLVYLEDITGENGQEVSLQKNSTHIQWRLGAGSWADLVPLEDIKGDAGPYFAFRVFEGVIQIRLNNAESGDPWINLFYALDELQALLDTEVPFYNTDQMSGVENTEEEEMTTVTQLQIPISGSVLTFKYPCQIGTFDTPLTTMTIDLTTPRKCESWAFVSAGTIPAVLSGSSVKFVGTAFSTDTDDTNFIRLIYLGDERTIKVLAINVVLDGVNS